MKSSVNVFNWRGLFYQVVAIEFSIAVSKPTCFGKMIAIYGSGRNHELFFLGH